MSLFYSSILLLLILALVFMFWPLFRTLLQSREDETEESVRQQTNISLYRDHLSELEQSLNNQQISQDQFAQLKQELERNLLEDSQATSQVVDQVEGTDNRTLLVLGGGVFLLVLSVLVYVQLGASSGSWQLQRSIEARSDLERQFLTTPNPELRSRIEIANNELLLELAGFIQDNPNDLSMRDFYARMLLSSGDYDSAIDQYRAMLTQQPEQPQIMAQLAQVVFLRAGNRVVPIVQSLVDAALEREPNNVLALQLAGISAFEKEAYAQAIVFWERAVPLLPRTSPNRDAIASGIAAARSRLTPSEADEIASVKVPTNSSPATADTTVEPNPEITLTVSLADHVQVKPEDAVFIYARAWQGARMPLAIARLQVNQLPVTLSLTNEMAMAPAMNLGTAEQWELVARVSQTGTAISESGDWQVTFGPVTNGRVDQSGYSLIISEQIP